jgi:hypothetical protein
VLAKSSKSRFAAIAIMALGVSTFMGTSAALATSVTVSGTVGGCDVPSTVAASAVVFGAVARGTTNLQSLSPTVTQGYNTDCSDKNSSVSASIGDFTGQAHTSNVPEIARVVVTIDPFDGVVFPMSARVPAVALPGADFGATVTLTLSGNG